jgi:hypothetical protein
MRTKQRRLIADVSVVLLYQQGYFRRKEADEGHKPRDVFFKLILSGYVLACITEGSTGYPGGGRPARWSRCTSPESDAHVCRSAFHASYDFSLCR